ncbi:hypothetical protein BS17DRAFT_774695 [Gyrodon lividus]|nr:hypothetical protein BS17DRAFT_774695 [Gyrodon lividus]
MASPAGFDLIVILATIFILVSTILALWTLVFLCYRAHHVHYYRSPSRRCGLRSYGFLHKEGYTDHSSIPPSRPLASNCSQGAPIFHVILTPPTPAKGASTDVYGYSDNKLSKAQSVHHSVP